MTDKIEETDHICPPECLPILERAVEIWAKPESRTQGALRITPSGPFCALGVLNQAAHEAHDMPIKTCVGDLDRLSRRVLGMDYFSVYQTNDTYSSGPSKLFKRMKFVLQQSKLKAKVET